MWDFPGVKNSSYSREFGWVRLRGELGRTPPNSAELGRTRLNSAELGWTRLNSAELGWRYLVVLGDPKTFFGTSSKNNGSPYISFIFKLYLWLTWRKSIVSGSLYFFKKSFVCCTFLSYSKCIFHWREERVVSSSSQAMEHCHSLQPRSACSRALLRFTATTARGVCETTTRVRRA